MLYQTLKSIYYKTPKEYKNEYNIRFNSPFTKKLPFTIKQFNHNEENIAFYCHTEEIVNLQSKIMKEYISFCETLGQIPGAGITQFLYTSLVEEIKSSNDIEGVHSSRREIKIAMTSAEQVRLSGIVNKYRKIITNETIALESCRDIRLLYNDVLYDEIKNDNPENLPDGELFRKGSVDILSSTNRTIHRGIYPEQKIIQYMEKALTILKDDQISIYIRIAIFHYFFGYIHPFYDGNGRMSRLITSYLISQELHPTIGLQVSLLLKKNRKVYYDLFQESDSEINKGDLTPFITGTLFFIYDAIQYTQSILNKKLNQYKTYSDKLPCLIGAKLTTLHKIYDILLQASIFSNGGATVPEIVSTINVSENTVSKYLKQIPEDRIIISKTGRPYQYRLNLNCLNQ